MERLRVLRAPGEEGGGSRGGRVVNDFHRTGLGQTFFNKTLPDLVQNLSRLADGVERVVKLLEEERGAAKGTTKGSHE